MNKVTTLFAKLNYAKTLAVAAVVAGLYFLGIYNDGSAIETSIKSTSVQITEQETKKKKTEIILAEASQYKSEVGTLGEKFKSASAKLPSEFKAQHLIDMINATAKDANLRVVNLQPGVVAKMNNYDEVPVKVKLRGSFSNIVMFLYFIGTIERITHVRNFIFLNEQDETKTGLLGFDATIVSFRFRTPEGGVDSKPGENAMGAK